MRHSMLLVNLRQERRFNKSVLGFERFDKFERDLLWYERSPITKGK